MEVKEAQPLATSLHLEGLVSFTRWIKKGSYYHGVVARQGHLQECPHLQGAPLPRWPQLAPSESRRELQMRAEAQVPGPRRPSAEATVAPITEAAVMVAPVTEAAVAEAPVVEAPTVESAIMEEMPAEAPTATPSLPAPMETGGVGDGPSWAKQVEEVEEEQFQHSRLAKGPRSLSRRWEPASQLPFPLQDYAGRFASVTQL